MKETTALNRIEKIIEDINYKKIYIEIETENNKYTLEKERAIEVLGFRKEKDKK